MTLLCVNNPFVKQILKGLLYVKGINHVYTTGLELITNHIEMGFLARTYNKLAK